MEKLKNKAKVTIVLILKSSELSFLEGMELAKRKSPARNKSIKAIESHFNLDSKYFSTVDSMNGLASTVIWSIFFMFSHSWYGSFIVKRKISFTGGVS